MNNKALFLGLVYAVLVIAFKQFILLGGYSLTKFGYFYSNITSVVMIIPFYVLVLKWVRDKDYKGQIGGREAMRICLSLFSVALVLISVYHYFEFSKYGQQLAEQYYHSGDFLSFLKTQKNVKPEDYSKIIEDQIRNSSGSAFKATTGKIFSYLILGISSAFIIAAAMKKSGPKTS